MLTAVQMLDAFDGYYEPPENPGEAMLKHIEDSGYVLVQRPEIEQSDDPHRFIRQYRLTGHVNNDRANAMQAVSKQVLAQVRDADELIDTVHRQLLRNYAALIAKYLIPDAKYLIPEQPKGAIFFDPYMKEPIYAQP